MKEPLKGGHKLGKRVLITAALPYANGIPHVGHVAGAYLPADIYSRFLRLVHVPVRTICGSDDHGVAIMLTASKEGKTPAEVAKSYHERQRKSFEGLGIFFDVYGSTSQNPYHAELSSDLFKKLYDKGYFEKKSSPQFFDDSRGVFLPDRFVKGTCGFCGTADQNGDQCEQCGKMLDVDSLKNPVSVLSGGSASVKDTVHWYLDLSRFEGDVAKWLEGAELREHTRSYVKGLLAQGLIKRSMTRDISWGVPVPLDDPDAKGKVLYVWFDAPIGYISNTKELCAKVDGDAEKYTDWWKSPDTSIFHFIGEDNTIFHAVIWIAMLKAEGSYSLPKGVIVNHFMNFKAASGAEEKFSKSKGNAIWIEDYLNEGGNPDILRYYVTSISPETSRTVFSMEELKARANGELGNVIGNFVNRVLQFNQKNFGPVMPDYQKDKVGDFEKKFAEGMEKAHQEIGELIHEFAFKAALERLMAFGREANKYFDDKAPWKSMKTDVEATKVTLAYCINAIKFMGVTMWPFLPFSAEKTLKMLSLDSAKTDWDAAIVPVPAGHKLGEPVILFPRME